MLITLWIVNGLLALAVIGAGATKLARPRQVIIASGMGWAQDYTDTGVKLIGLAEVLGGLGLVLPLATGIAVLLSPLAAAGLAALMAGAVVVHRRRRENPAAAAVLTALAAASAVLGLLFLV